MSEKGLDSISPSKVDTYDPVTTWGCPTRFFLKYVQERGEPEFAAGVVGTECHQQNEHYLKTGENVLGRITLPGKGIIDEYKPRVVGVEVQMPQDYHIEGIRISSRSKTDVRLIDGVVDWKTTSKLAYMKTTEQLRKNSQIIIYLHAGWSKGWFSAKLSALWGDHVYFLTKGRPHAERVPALLDIDKHLVPGIENVRRLVREMKDVAKETEAKKVPPNLNACNVGKGCPHRHYCPHQGGKEDIMASLMAKFKAESPGGVTEAVVEKPTGTLPPDAPKSDPAKAAEPMPAADKPFNPIPEPLKPGLEPRDINTGNVVTDPALRAIAGVPAAAEAPEKKKKPGRRPKIQDEEPKATGLVVKSVTVRHGLTLNMGNYQSARIEVEMSADIAGSSVDARVALGKQVYEAAMQEATKYEPKK